MATSGAQPGNRNAAKAKIWTAAIERALAKRSRDRGIEAVDELAENLLSLCSQGDMVALKELGDRLEGKPHQSNSTEMMVKRDSDMSDEELAQVARSAAANA